VKVILCLTKILISSIIQREKDDWWIMKVKACGRKRPWTNLRVLSGCCGENLKNTSVSLNRVGGEILIRDFSNTKLGANPTDI
jgi:hypothetical protein